MGLITLIAINNNDVNSSPDVVPDFEVVKDSGQMRARNGSVVPLQWRSKRKEAFLFDGGLRIRRGVMLALWS